MTSCTFISKRIRNNAFKIDSVYFQIKRVLGKRKSAETFDATVELEELLENGTIAAGSVVSGNHYSSVKSRFKGAGGKLEKYNWIGNRTRKKNQQDQDFFLCDGAYTKNRHAIMIIITH